MFKQPTKKPRKNEESKLQSAAMKRFKSVGFEVIRTNAGTFQGAGGHVRGARPGTADCIMCVPGGKFVAVEFKTPKGRVSDIQQKFLDRIKRLGGACYVVRTMDEVEQVIKEQGNG